MVYYGDKYRDKVRRLRGLGRTYTEISEILNIKVSKSTLSYWCKGIILSKSYVARVRKINNKNLKKARQKAIRVNKINRQKYLETIDNDNVSISKHIDNENTALIALSMLCLGEASKSKTKHRSFTLGSSDPRIIVIFLALLEKTKDYDASKLRFRVQCRADQDTKKLEKYWKNIVKMPNMHFYSALIDPRTKDKPTKNKNYKGVLAIDYFDKNIQLILESLADLVYNRLKSIWAHSVVG